MSSTPTGTSVSSARSTGVLVAAMVLLWLCWGTSFPAMRVMVATLPPLTASAAIFLTAGLVLAATRPRAVATMSRRDLATAAGPGLCLLGAQGTVAVAVQYLYASTAALLVAAIPLWVAVLGAVAGDRPTRGSVFRLLLGFAGVAVVLLADTSDGDGAGWSVWGLVVIAAAISWAAGTLWASRVPTGIDPSAGTAVQLLVGGVLLLAVAAAVGELSPASMASVEDAGSGASWAAFGYLVLVDSLAGFVLFNWLLRRAPVGLVSTYAYAAPVVAYLVGVLILDEPFRVAVLVGAAIILAAVAGEVRSQTTTATQPVDPTSA